MKSHQEIIDEVMDYMDFERIHKTMKYLDWMWVNVGVPDIPTIRKHVRRLLSDFLNRNLKRIASGGFEISKDEEGVIEVKFILTSIEIFPENYIENEDEVV